MKTFVLVTAVLLVSSSAFAGATRGLSAAEPTRTAAVAEAAPVQETAKPSVADQLKALSETPKTETVNPKTEQAAAPLPAVEIEEPVSKSAKVSNQRDARAELRPGRKTNIAKKVQRDSDERKARRYAGYFGIRW